MVIRLQSCFTVYHLFYEKSHAIWLPLSHFFLRGWSYKATGGMVHLRNWWWPWTVVFRSIVCFHKNWPIMNRVQSLHWKTIYFKDWVNCSSICSCFSSWFLSSLLLLAPFSSLFSSFLHLWGTQVVLGQGLWVSQGFCWQASAREDAT